MSSILHCPHCNKPVTNDPALAGQVVRCPHCHENLTMPAMAILSPLVTNEPPDSYRSRQKGRKSSKGKIALFVVGGLMLLGLVARIVEQRSGGKRSDPDLNAAIERSQATLDRFDKEDRLQLSSDYQRLAIGTTKLEIQLDYFLRQWNDFKVTSENRIGGYKNEVFTYQDADVVIVLQFQDDRLIQKSQSGLD